MGCDVSHLTRMSVVVGALVLSTACTHTEMKPERSARLSAVGMAAIRLGMSEREVARAIGDPLSRSRAQKGVGDILDCARGGLDTPSYRTGYECRVYVEHDAVVWAVVRNWETHVECRCDAKACVPDWADACFRPALHKESDLDNNEMQLTGGVPVRCSTDPQHRSDTRVGSP
jgi:hypothetical protein